MFDTLESRMNAAVLAKLANATAVIGGEVVVGVFSNEAMVDQNYVEGRQPVFTCLASDISGLTQGDAITVTYHETETSYLMGSKAPDGTGLVKIILEEY